MCDGHATSYDVSQVITRSIWDILGYGHTGLKTSYDHLLWPKFWWSWTIGVTRAMLWDVIRRRSHRGASNDVLAVFGHVQKPGFDARAWIVSYIILSRNVLRYRLTSCDVADVCTVFYIHVLTCTAFSRCCAIVRDRATIVKFILFQMLTSASRQI